MRWLAIGVVLIVTPLLLVGTGGHALRNGDEAIYAQIGREAADDGHWAVPTWQNRPQIGRPHGIGWSLGVARILLRVADHPDRAEAAVRWPLALVCALEAALLLLLGARLFSPAAGIAAAGLLVTSDLFVGYARYLESEPYLCLLALAAFLCWERAREKTIWIVGWGLCLGASLMIKQFVGALPLLAWMIDRLQRDRPRVRGAGWGLLVAFGLWLPWHAFMLARFGRPFLDAYFFGNIVHRGAAAMHHATRASYYLRELWRSEGLGALGAAAGIGFALVELRKRATGPLLVIGWALPVLAVFSAAASRYDYYLLLIYPALALAAGALLAKLPLRGWLIAALVVAAGAAHLPRNLSTYLGEDEVRQLVQSSPSEPIYLYNTHGYAARFYSRADVTTLLESQEDEEQAVAFRNMLPSSTRYAPDLPAALASLPRPFLLFMPRPRASLLPSGLNLVGESKHFLVLEAR